MVDFIVNQRRKLSLSAQFKIPLWIMGPVLGYFLNILSLLMCPIQGPRVLKKLEDVESSFSPKNLRFIEIFCYNFQKPAGQYGTHGQGAPGLKSTIAESKVGTL